MSFCKNTPPSIPRIKWPDLHLCLDWKNTNIIRFHRCESVQNMAGLVMSFCKNTPSWIPRIKWLVLHLCLGRKSCTLSHTYRCESGLILFKNVIFSWIKTIENFIWSVLSCIGESVNFVKIPAFKILFPRWKTHRNTPAMQKIEVFSISKNAENLAAITWSIPYTLVKLLYIK